MAKIFQVLVPAAKAFPAVLDRFQAAVRAAVTAIFRDSIPMAFREAAEVMAALISLVRMFPARMLVAEDPAAERVLYQVRVVDMDPEIPMKVFLQAHKFRPALRAGLGVDRV
jgi:hypothetical protein